MKPPLTFTCSHCLKPLGVALEHAGKAVTCPHCEQVVKAPAAAAPVAPPVPIPAADIGIAEQHANSFTSSQMGFREREDSIFGEAVEDEDEEALFGLGSGKKGPMVDIPETSTPIRNNTPLELSPPTKRVPGLSPPIVPNHTQRIQPVVKVPLAEVDAQIFTASAHPSPNGGTVDAMNPFEMEAVIPTEFSENAPAPSANPRRRKEAEPDTVPNWKLWITIGLGAYSFLMTIVAVWGWTRSPAAPVKTDTQTPATQKAKPR